MTSVYCCYINILKMYFVIFLYSRQNAILQFLIRNFLKKNETLKVDGETEEEKDERTVICEYLCNINNYNSS
jgi:hypothetical protein